MKTSIASCTPKEITPSEIATPSMTNTQEKTVRGTLKKTIRKKDEDNHEDKRFQKSRGDSSSNLHWGPKFQKQTSRKASSTNHHGSRTGYSKISQLVTVSNLVFKRRPMD